MRTAHEHVLDDLAALVAGDADAIAKHADHLAGCDDCRDAKYEATQLAEKLSMVGRDYVAKPSLVEDLLAKIQGDHANVTVNVDVKSEAKPTEEKPLDTKPAAEPAKTIEASPAQVKTIEAKAEQIEAKAEQIEAKAEQIEAKAVEAKSEQAKVEQPKTIEAKAIEAKAIEAKAIEAKAIGAKTIEAKSEQTTADAKSQQKSIQSGSSVSKPVGSRASSPTPISAARSKRTVIAAGALAALAAGATGLVLLKKHSGTSTTTTTVVPGGPIGKVATISRASSEAGDGISIKTTTGWRSLRADEMIPAGAELRTDDRTRTSLELADGTRVVLDHATTVAFEAAEPRHMRLTSGRIAADIAHVDNRPAFVTTPHGRIDVVGTRFSVTATDQITSVQVVRGTVKMNDSEVRSGEEAIIENGKLSVSAAPSLVKDNQWSELAQPQKNADDSLAGLGALRAYKPGEKRDRDWKLALANHEVKVRIVGPIARTEITETFRNDSDTTLEGVYQFPLPADAQIDSLALDMKDQPGGFITGAFVDKDRANKIWKGVIDKATPKHIERDPLIQQEIVWVPGPWKDPALLDWKRGGRFELKIFPIPAKGARTIKLSYTQVVTPRGPWRQYVYPLAHSFDGSTVADKFKVDVEVRGAQHGSVRTVGYQMTSDGSRNDVDALAFEQGGFVPRGDLVVDYRAEQGDAELRAWTFAGGAAAGPDDKLAAKKNVGIDSKVVDAQRVVAADARPTAVIALSPKLPRWQENKARDYMIVVDGSQSMVGERFTRASELAVAMVSDMDRRDRFGVLVCDSECTKFGDLRAPSSAAAGDLKTWFAAQQPAGSSDVVASLRAGNDALTDTQHERWVIYVGDGFASSGFRRMADVEKAIASTTTTSNVHVSTIGIGNDADSALLAAAARGGGGSYVAWVPGMTTNTAALAALESTNGTTLRDAVVELPAGMADVAAQGGANTTATTTTLPTVRAGGEVLIAARIDGNVAGEVVLRGKVAGEKFEQRYPVKLEVSSAPGNGFVPRLWASLAIDQLERGGKGEDRARIVALSQGYGVMSRETSLLVLESQAMFDAFGVDRSQSSAPTWTGEEDIEETTASGVVEVPDDSPTKKTAMPKVSSKMDAPAADFGGDSVDTTGTIGHGYGGGRGSVAATGAAPAAQTAPAPAPVAEKAKAMDRDEAEMQRPMPRGGRRMVIAMKKVWTRNAAIGRYDGVNAAITKSVASAEDELAKNPDSREKHRALVQALSYAGDLDKAREVANRWLDRDKLDPQALGYIADLLGRDGKRDLALRTLDGLVDLDPDKANLHERMVNAFERAGHMQQACSHRIAMVSIDIKEAAKRAAAAARCLRSLGRSSDADLVMASLVDDKARTEAEKLATVAPVTSRISGDLIINAKWDQTADLDISLIAPDGSRVSWMGGRTDINVADSTAHDREQLAVKKLRRGNYLVEITRGEQTSTPVRGTLDVSVLGQKIALPFELTGTHATVGRISVTLTSHLEPVNPADARWLQMGRRIR